MTRAHQPPLITANFHPLVQPHPAATTTVPTHLPTHPLTHPPSCAEENLLCDTSDSYRGEDICLHETTHGLHGKNMRTTRYYESPTGTTTLTSKLEQVFAASRSLWANSYQGKRPRPTPPPPTPRPLFAPHTPLPIHSSPHPCSPHTHPSLRSGTQPNPPPQPADTLTRRPSHL